MLSWEYPPLLVGGLVDAGWRPTDIYYVFVAPVLLAAVAVACVRSAKPVAQAEPVVVP